MYWEAGARHNTPHFHAYYQEATAIFSIDPIELMEGFNAETAASFDRSVG